MEWNARWVPLIGTGTEKLHLLQNDEGVFIDSNVIGTKHGQSFRAWYKIYCDQGWKVQTCILHRSGPRAQELKLQVDNQGHWVNADNECHHETDENVP